MFWRLASRERVYKNFRVLSRAFARCTFGLLFLNYKFHVISALDRVTSRGLCEGDRVLRDWDRIQ